MIIPRPEDAIHKAALYRLLAEVLDDGVLAQNIYFKGGTCATALDWLDRFSLDLDFDRKEASEKKILRLHLREIFARLGYIVDQEDDKELFYVLKYPMPQKKRNTLKLSIINTQLKSNTYAVFSLPEIDRLAKCQTQETMFANKLVAVLDRYEKYRTIAGRDIYDIWYFFNRGFGYRPEIIQERRKIGVLSFFKELTEFVKNNVTERVISEDLNYLLPQERFNQVRKTLKMETLIFLRDEMTRLVG